MLLASFGSPSALSYATANILRCISDELYGGHFFIHVTQLDELREKWFSVDKQQKKCVVLFSDCPQKQVSELVTGARSPVVLVIEDFPSIVGYVVRSRDMAFAPAVRFATQVVCALDLLARSPGVLRVSGCDHARSLASFVEALISFFGARCSDERYRSIMSNLAPDGSAVNTVGDYVSLHFPHAREVLNGNPPVEAESAAFSVLNESYGRLTTGQPVSAFNWPVSLFLKWDTPGAFLDGPVELLGPARFIICGPYLHLPEGRWRMNVEIETDECYSDNRIGADIFSERILAAITAKLPACGRYAFGLDFEVSNPLAPVEIRMQVVTGCIEGRLTLVNVRLERLTSDSAKG